MKLPHSDELKAKASADIEAHRSEAERWIDSDLAVLAIRRAHEFSVCVPMHHCQGPLRAAVLHVLKNLGYVARVEESHLLTGGHDRLHVSWPL